MALRQFIEKYFYFEDNKNSKSFKHSKVLTYRASTAYLGLDDKHISFCICGLYTSKEILSSNGCKLNKNVFVYWLKDKQNQFGQLK